MPSGSIAISGAEEVIRMLESAPKVVVAKGFLRAADAAGKVIVRELWPRTPIDPAAVGNLAHGGKGLLVSRLDAFIELDSRFRGVKVEVGFGPLGHIALWHDQGWKLTGHKPGKRFIKNIPGTAFMRQAYDASAQKAVDAFAESLEQTLRAGI